MRGGGEPVLALWFQSAGSDLRFRTIFWLQAGDRWGGVAGELEADLISQGRNSEALTKAGW